MKTTTDLRARARAVADACADAFSWDNYGERGWRSAALVLLTRGYSEREAEAILRSKWTRWAADAASERKGWRYGRTTGADLARFLDAQPVDRLAIEVAELVAGTFPGESL